MKHFGLIALLLAGGVALAATKDSPNLAPMPQGYNDNVSRPCIMVPGGWTPIDASNSAAALSGQISDFSAFLLQCDADAHFTVGTSAEVADSDDGWIAAGAILKLATDSKSRYVSVLNVSDATADCRYVECR